MKKLTSTVIVLLFAIAVFADKRAEITVLQPGIVNKVTVYFDNGSSKPEIVKNDNGKKFESPVVAINYFINKGWKVKEMHVNTLSIASIVRVYVIIKKED